MTSSVGQIIGFQNATYSESEKEVGNKEAISIAPATDCCPTCQSENDCDCHIPDEDYNLADLDNDGVVEEHESLIVKLEEEYSFYDAS